jgi:hypothetical protein
MLNARIAENKKATLRMAQFQNPISKTKFQKHLWTAAALGCVLPIFVWIHFRNLPVWTAAKTQRLIANG